MLEKLKMSEETARFLRSIASVVTVLGLVFGGLYTLKQYFDARATDSRNFAFQLKVAQTEAQKDYYSKVMSMCFDLTSATGTIATPSQRRKNVKKQSRRFGVSTMVPHSLFGTAICKLRYQTSQAV